MADTERKKCTRATCQCVLADKCAASGANTRTATVRSYADYGHLDPALIFLDAVSIFKVLATVYAGCSLTHQKLNLEICNGICDSSEA
jgi:hypothetical protein